MPFQYDTFNAQPATGRIADLMQQGGQIRANAALNRGQGAAQMGQVIAQGAGQALGTIGQLFQQKKAAQAQQAHAEAVGRVLHDATNDDGTYDPMRIQAGAQQVGLPPEQTQSLLDWTDKKNKAVLDTMKARQDLVPRPEKIGTRLVTTKGADGSETSQIVPDTPGQTFTSAAPPKADKTETRSLDVQAADALARGDTDTYKRLLQVKKEMGQADDRPRVTVMTGTSGTSDVKESVAGMKDGTLPPQLPGRASKDYTAIMAEAHRQGYDLTKAATDWSATQKHFATLNGAQQTRLRQAVVTASDSLGVIEDLAKQWDGGKFPILNRAQLKLAMNGAMGPKAQQLATNLNAQITDVTSELGNVYMGGNSPTDHALSLASKNLSADWTKDQLLSAIALARTNLRIRQNSIQNVEAVTTSSQSAAPAAGAGRMRVKGPNGETGTMPSNAVLPSGWVKQ